MSDELMKHLANKVDKLDSRLDSIDVTLAEQHVTLQEHMRRTYNIEEELKPIKLHVSQVDGALKFVGISSTVISVILGVLRLLGKI